MQHQAVSDHAPIFFRIQRNCNKARKTTLAFRNMSRRKSVSSHLLNWKLLMLEPTDPDELVVLYKAALAASGENEQLTQFLEQA